MMTQGLLPFQYEIEKSASGLTSFAGLPLYMDLAMAMGLCSTIKKQLDTKSQGWTDVQIIMSLILLNIAGGDCVDDIDRLESDDGMRMILLKLQTYGMKRKARRDYERRWRRSKDRAFPSASAIRRYLEQFHNPSEEVLREEGKAFIPAPNQWLSQLLNINRELINAAQQKHSCPTATLDQDATLSASHKRSALFCYKKFKAYQPFNTYWYEQGLLLHSEFRDGNVNAGFEQLRLLIASLDQLPTGVETVYLRSDSAGYQQDLLSYCGEGKHPRFGVIEFAIAARVTAAFKEAVSAVKAADWHPIYKTDDKGHEIQTDQEWAEVCFVPNVVAAKTTTPDYRYLAIREPMVGQSPFNDTDEPIKQTLPFQTLDMQNTAYKLFAVVTNRTMPGNELINWHRERCGQSEKLHSVEKADLAGGQFPSGKFGANAAWWQIMILAFNLNGLMKMLILPEPLKTKRMKALRFHVIGVAGRLVQHARGLRIKLSNRSDIFDRLMQMREKIVEIARHSVKLHPI